MMIKNKKLATQLSCISIAVALLSCGADKTEKVITEIALTHQQYTENDLKVFLEKAGDTSTQMTIDYTRAAWAGITYTTPDTQKTSQVLSNKFAKQQEIFIEQVKKFNDIEVSPTLRRQVDIMTFDANPAPNTPESAELLTKTSNELINVSQKTLNCAIDNCRNTATLNKLMTEQNSYEDLLTLWLEAGEQYKPMKAMYEVQVAMANEGAKDNGYADFGTVWRSAYDMPEQEFSAVLETVWGQIKPLYNSMQCHIKTKLSDKFGGDKVALNKTIPAHLLGSFSGNTWKGIESLVIPETRDLKRNYNINEALVTQNYDAIKIVKTAEFFYTSMGFEPLPESFWQRSQFVEPQYPKGGYASTNCRAFPYDTFADGGKDQRLHMCIEPDEKNFNKVHSILEFNYYAMAYQKYQPYYFKNLAGDPASFWAMNNAMELSLTPEYLNKIGLIKEVPDTSHDIAFLMEQAFDKIMNIPYNLAAEKWRWQVYSGEVSPNQYNQAWWKLREEYQGVSAPIERTIDDFDPGADRYIVHNRSLKDKLVGSVLSFQFQKALCEAVSSEATGNEIVRHRCTVYQSKEAGDRMQAMFKLGKSVPWQQALSTLSGDPEGRIDLDGTAIIEYFAPLQQYLDEKNEGLSCAI
jgi:peptidyl-dipeptidase A